MFSWFFWNSSKSVCGFQNDLLNVGDTGERVNQKKKEKIDTFLIMRRKYMRLILLFFLGVIWY